MSGDIPAGETARITFIGGPTVLIEIGGFRLVTDPTFDPPGLYTTAPVRFEKTRGPAIPVEDIGEIDAVLLSHDQHLDNLDHAGRALLPRARAVYTTKVGATRLGGNAIGLVPFETATLEVPGKGRLLITAAPARHGPVGIEPITGEVVGLLVGRDAPGDALYVTGDTVWYEGVAEVARRFAPKVVLAFAGSAEPRGTFHLTMDSNDVIEVAHAFPQARIVGIHNDGWIHFKESAADLEKSLAALGLADRLVPLPPGAPVPFAV